MHYYYGIRLPKTILRAGLSIPRHEGSKGRNNNSEVLGLRIRSSYLII